MKTATSPIVPLILQSILCACTPKNPLNQSKIETKAKSESVSLSINLGQLDPIQQLLEFESKFNLPKYYVSDSALTLQSFYPAKDTLKSKFLGDSAQLQKFLTNINQQIRWFKHPFNRSPNVPFFNDHVDLSLDVKAHLSASRSLFFGIPASESCKDSWYSIKLPTDHIRPELEETRKASLSAELNDSEMVGQHFIDIEPKPFESEASLRYLIDIATVIKQNPKNEIENGFKIRDLRPLCKSNKYYLPAFSVDTEAGVAIYEKCTRIKANPGELKDFWRKHFAESVSKAKAELIFNFGFAMTTPNAQNWLIELSNPSFCPTGKIVVRDIVDSLPSVFAMNAAKKSKFLQQWKKNGGTTLEESMGVELLHDTSPYHLKKLWETTRQSQWEFDSYFLEASIDAYFGQIATLANASRNQDWIDAFPTMRKLQVESKQKVPRFLKNLEESKLKSKQP